MSVWNIQLRERRVTITIAKIIQKWSENAGKFPKMKILDTKGREHIVDCFDIPCSLSAWDKISEGDKIVLFIREKLIHKGFVLPKRRLLKIKQAEIPESPYHFRWTCPLCGKTGIVSYYNESIQDVGDRIDKKHLKKRPKCESETLQVINQDGKDVTDEYMQIRGKRAKIRD
ncbi:MAG: hypothetical protein FJZ16_08980 [Candidatus Omnitrophica bacterium]|nr:hypothetical protein [Candidatus Omnitrophota bacterium]